MDRQFEVSEAAKVLGKTSRSIYRMLQKVRLDGIRGIIHGNKGNKYAQKYSPKLKAKILDLVKNKYKGFNDIHFMEKLAEIESVEVNPETLRQILRRAGIKPKKKHRRKRYYRKRERKESFGMMIQIDASIHDWLDGRGPKMTIVGGIDDATGHVWASFEKSESTWAYLRLIKQIIMDKGVPLSLYSDRHTIFHSTKEPTIIEQLENCRPLTQFGRAMDELGIQLIKAWSPQAKGRIERVWGTFQDRLIAEMSLANVKSKDEANKILKRFLIDFNKRFTHRPRKVKKVFRQRPSIFKLDRILCLKDTRVVNNDHTVKFEGLVFQIPPSSKCASIAKQKVTILQLGDGSVEIIYKRLIVARFDFEKVVKIVKYCGFGDDHILLAA